MPKAQKIDKPKNMRASFGLLIKSIGKFKFAIFVSVVLTVASALLGLFIPKLLGDMTTIAVDTYPEINWGLLGQKAILIIGLFVGSAVLNYGQAYILAVVTAKYTKDLREKILVKISRLPIRYFDKHKHGDTLSRMSNDVDILTTSLAQTIADTSMNLTILVGVMIIMLTI